MRREQIGEWAGKVWHYLHANGKTPVHRLKLELGLSLKEVSAALGWLAKEDKLILECEDNAWQARLKT